MRFVIGFLIPQRCVGGAEEGAGRGLHFTLINHKMCDFKYWFTSSSPAVTTDLSVTLEAVRGEQNVDIFPA